MLIMHKDCLKHAPQHGHSTEDPSHPPTPVTHNNPALRIKSEGATSEEVRGIGNGENLDKIVTFVLGVRDG